MTVRESVPLSTLTTLRVGGPARYVIDLTEASQLPHAVAFAREQQLPVYLLGEGSNVLAPDAGYDGVVVCVRTQGIEFRDQGTDVFVTAAAGVPWDALVEEAVMRSLWGIENLAGIPGTAGAAPVQNIGAYGVEFESALQTVEAFDLTTGDTHTFTREECGFSYRESRFKQERNLAITRITLRLTRNGAPQTAYADLSRWQQPLDTPKRIADAVRSIRAKKFPDLSIEGSAGSFFKNPIITESAYETLAERFTEVIRQYGPIPRYPFQEAGKVKVPLAYFLDKVLGLRGYAKGRAHLFSNQPLVLVTEAGATAADVNALADDVAAKIFAATSLSIEREVRSMN